MSPVNGNARRVTDVFQKTDGKDEEGETGGSTEKLAHLILEAAEDS